MRIIGGQYKSRLIEMPKGADMRPTQDRVREAVFNLLGNVAGASVLELFAGSGAFALEALSRGAAHATFVDNNVMCIETIKANLSSLKVSSSLYGVIKANALGVFPRLENAGIKFNLVFLDPPYYKDIARKCLINIDSCDILAHAGLVVAEHSRKDDLSCGLETLVPEKERRYGDTVISIYRKHKLL